jgi:medium-chain acyl-[acyl-carrier-protein] hydrolase
MTGRVEFDRSTTWFERVSHTSVPSFRLFCLPYAGGSPDVYRSWRKWLAPQLDICLVHLPGHGRNLGQQGFRRLVPLVQELADRMDCGTDLPFAIYGHSMGALIAFELASELLRRGCKMPQLLLVSGRRAPHCPSVYRQTFDLPDEEFLSELRRLNGTPAEVLDNPELIKLFIDVIRDDFELVDTYEYQPGERLPCPICVYGGIDDEDVSIESNEAWQEHTSVSCKVRMFQGDHFFIRKPSPTFIEAFAHDVESAIAPCTPKRSLR